LAKKKLFSPNQVFACAFLGGPMAMVYALWKNFQTLESPRDMQQVLFWGSIFIIALLLFSPFIPDWVDIALPIGYSMAARSLAERHQMTKRAIAESAQYEFQPIWNVAVVCVVFFIAILVVTFALFFALVAIGLV